MKITKIIIPAFISIIIAACSTSKKSTTSTNSSAPVSNTPLIFLKPPNGIFAPGNEELAAIQLQYKEVTLDLLKEGHEIYTQGTCIKCHTAQNIYERGEVQWKGIMDSMAKKARLSRGEKDAVYKYVLAIKATQPKADK